MDGTELKLRRIAAHVKAKDLGLAAGWAPYKVSRIESRAFVLPEDVARYVAALGTLSTKTTEAVA